MELLTEILWLIKMDYFIINWSVDSVDWRDQDVDLILINALPDVRDGAIMLFHSARGTGQNPVATAAALPELIETLRKTWTGKRTISFPFCRKR
ncbi:MAG: hypothetical protein Q7J85_06515 [Bacillota bacterium]|nr:hypothetical protein [Bacillota bacterium]